MCLSLSFYHSWLSLIISLIYCVIYFFYSHRAYKIIIMSKKLTICFIFVARSWWSSYKLIFGHNHQPTILLVLSNLGWRHKTSNYFFSHTRKWLLVFYKFWFSNKVIIFHNNYKSYLFFITTIYKIIIISGWDLKFKKKHVKIERQSFF